MTTHQSASLAVHGGVKRGNRNMEPKAPLTCGGEAPTARSEFFTIIPILAHTATAQACTPPRAPALARRRFLQSSGLLFGTLATGSALAQLAPSRDWVLPLQALSSREGRTLMLMGRTLYPHDQLPNAVYALLAKDLDAQAQTNADLAHQLREGVASLDAASGGNFAQADVGQRLAAVQSLRASPFFATVRGQCITSLYDNDMAWAAFGYEGSSFEHGGYLMRGFQDLQWLPATDAADSPPPFSG